MSSGVRQKKGYRLYFRLPIYELRDCVFLTRGNDFLHFWSIFLRAPTRSLSSDFVGITGVSRVSTQCSLDMGWAFEEGGFLMST